MFSWWRGALLRSPAQQVKRRVWKSQRRLIAGPASVTAPAEPREAARTEGSGAEPAGGARTNPGAPWEEEKPRRALRSSCKWELGRAQSAALLGGAGSHRPPGNGSVRAAGISQTAVTLRRYDALERRLKTSPRCSVGWDAAWRAGQRPEPAPSPPLPPTSAYTSPGRLGRCPGTQPSPADHQNSLHGGPWLWSENRHVRLEGLGVTKPKHIGEIHFKRREEKRNKSSRSGPEMGLQANSEGTVRKDRIPSSRATSLDLPPQKNLPGRAG